VCPILEVAAEQKRVALQRQLEAEDDMSAYAFREGVGGAGGDEADEGQVGSEGEPKRGASLALTQTRIAGNIDLSVKRITELSKDTDAKVMAIMAEAETVFQNNEQGKAPFVDDLREKHALAKAHWAKLEENLIVQKTKVLKAEHFSTCMAAYRDAQATSKEMKHGAVKTLSACTSTFGRTKASMKRSIDSAARVDAGKKAKSSSPPTVASATFRNLATALEAVAGGTANCSNSAFETKAGSRPCKLEHTEGDICAEMLKHVYVRACKRESEKQVLQGHGTAYTVMADDAKSRAVLRRLRKGWDATCFSAQPTPVDKWSIQLWRPAVFASEPNQVYTGLPHYGCMNARVVLSGSQVLFGMKTQEIDGADLREKKNFMVQIGAELIAQRIAEKRAFIITAEPGVLVMLPSDILYTVATLESTVGLRWCVAGDDPECERVALSLESAMECFPELKQPARGYLQYLGFLRS